MKCFMTEREETILLCTYPAILQSRHRISHQEAEPLQVIEEQQLYRSKFMNAVKVMRLES